MVLLVKVGKIHMPSNFTPQEKLNFLLRDAAKNDSGPLSMKMLLERGAEINGADEDGNTPLHYATKSKCNSVSTIKFLVENDADVDKMNHLGATPLHYAAQNFQKKKEVIKILRENNATLDVKDKRGKTPSMYARKQKVSVRLKYLFELLSILLILFSWFSCHFYKSIFSFCLYWN
jgi:ankyrin repeat protein